MHYFMLLVLSTRFIAVAVNDSSVHCMWKSVIDAQQYTIFSCSSRLQDRLCHVSVDVVFLWLVSLCWYIRIADVSDFCGSFPILKRIL